jgi:nitrogen fixation/metabolism regulation signal transduction histidine kinase
MNEKLISDDNYLRTVIDALPSAVLVVDHEFNIFDLNPAAKNLFGMDSDLKQMRMCGMVMHCVHALESGDGCGTTDYCSDCVVRNAAEAALKGQTVHRKHYRMQIQKKEGTFDIPMLVTASPFNYDNRQFALLVLEDITEVTHLRGLLPICTSCKKIRNDNDYWEAVYDYLKKHTDIEFTHSICPECAHKLYPELGF